MAHSFYAFFAPPIIVGVLLTCQSLDPEYKTTAFFQMYFQEKKHSYIRVNTVIVYLLYLVYYLTMKLMNKLKSVDYVNLGGYMLI